MAGLLGLHGRAGDRLVDVVVGGQFGSEGKGQIAAHLAPEYGVLIRVGGPNAGHKVFEKPEPYTFHLLPSGTRRSGDALIALAPGAVLNVAHLMKEIADCEIGVGRLFIDPQAMIIEGADIDAEKPLVAAIGSTGQGVGKATERKISRGADVHLARDIPELKPYIRPTQLVLEDAYSRGTKILLEGTQGSGLSLHHGYYPHVTSRDTTVSGCLSEAGVPPSRVRRVVMVCRTYPIRVESPKQGHSGPMSREITLEEVAKRSGLPLTELQTTEVTSTTKRKRRIAEFDWDLLRRATALNGPTDIALTFADYLDAANQKARRFDQLQPDTIRFIEEVERVSRAAVSLIATRFDYRSIIDRRSW